MKKYLLLLVLTFVASVNTFALAPQTLTRGPITITTIDFSDGSSIDLDSVQTLSFHTKNKSKFFLDQTNKFLFDFHTADQVSSDIDSIRITVSDYSFVLQGGLRPFMVSGLSHGDHYVKVERFQAGETVPFDYSGGKLKFKLIDEEPFFLNDAIVLGLLLLILAFIFYTSQLGGWWKKLYKYVPSLLLCYFIPSIFNSLGIISGEYSGLYYMASRYLLPASLILLCLSIDLKGIFRLGPKALTMFLTATVGIIIGGPIAILIVSTFSPETVGGAGPEAVWKGLSTVAGSWIGGGANQAAMKEVYEPSASLFSNMIVVDVIVANIWMAFLLYGAGISDKIDKWFKADSSAITELKQKLEGHAKKTTRITSTSDIMIIVSIGLVGTAIAHYGSQRITGAMEPYAQALSDMGLSSLTSGFFWLIVIATTLGVVMSFTKMRSYEGAGASKIGSVFLYVLVAAIGSHMDITAIFDNPGLFLVGIIWMVIHVILLLGVAKLIRAPFFFVAVGSQANVGGAASAPIVASAFSPALAPVGVLLAVLGYALGTYGAWICAELMAKASPVIEVVTPVLEQIP
jgi:uncharacterized membrane protein